MRDFYPTFVLTAFVLVVITVLSLMPPERGPVLVLFNPLETEDSHIGAIIRADALLVGPGRLPGSFLVASDDGNLPARLMASGALMVVNPYGAAGCAPRVRRSGAFAAADGMDLE
ncbi:hypothetical protein [Kordiimonas gwangyangensis]|uniref:hypothetical protein n=1 Tax=Kordiimonas gwangyangensis TaxID=288022 RepID=UPI0003669380|nr:hypothetical protein [Kordiimonas gwangyangensis]